MSNEIVIFGGLLYFHLILMSYIIIHFLSSATSAYCSCYCSDLYSNDDEFSFVANVSFLGFFFSEVSAWILIDFPSVAF